MGPLTQRSVQVVTLGRMGFMAAYDVQMRYAREHLDELAGKPYTYGKDTLFLVEHKPVYTVGIRDKAYSRVDETRLKKTGADFCRTNRGGLITFHGPGQLVAYPVLNLQRFKPSMRWYVGQLEQTLIQTVQKFGLTGRTTDQTGVWVEDRKIASIGLHGSRYVTTHGVSLNCDTDLSWFDHIVPCGLRGVEMTSLSQEVGQQVPYHYAIRPFLKSFQEVFDCDLEYKMLDESELELLGVKYPSQTEEKVERSDLATETVSMTHPAAEGRRESEAYSVSTTHQAAEGRRRESEAYSAHQGSQQKVETVYFSGVPMW